MTARMELEGTNIGNWELLKRIPRSRFICRCVCGREKIVSLSNMRSGDSLSCGCVGWKISAKSSVTHGACLNGKESKEYRSWKNMMTRCYNSKCEMYEYYGGKGISVCKEWFNFSIFYKDMGDCPSGYSIDRIDSSLGYFKENCRWASNSTQAFNRKLFKNTSGRRGVCIRGKSITASITINYQRMHLGSFKSIEDASKARADAELKYFGFTSQT